MEFLVHIEVRWPADGDPDELARLVEAEASEGERAGCRRHDPSDSGEFPDDVPTTVCGRPRTPPRSTTAISSLPFFPWLDVEVIALAEHPSDPLTIVRLRLR